MDNLGRAIYMAAFALLFIVAATVSIYLYGSLTSYLSETTSITGMTSRAEGATENSNESTDREITRAEILIVLFNMKQMNVSSVTVDGVTVTSEMVDAYNGRTGPVRTLIYSLTGGKRYDYSFNGSAVTYTSIN